MSGEYKDMGIDPAFAALLGRQREAINGFFQQARHFSHQLPAEAVYQFLTETLQPLVLAARPLLDDEALDRLALKLVVLALDLIGKHLLTADGDFALIEAGWRRLFCRYPALLVSSPRRAIAAVSNALVHLCLHPGAQASKWLDELEAGGEHCPDLKTFLELGQVLAWRCGLAHYRQGALELLPNLPVSLQSKLLQGLPIEQWRQSPWTGASDSNASIQIIHISGEYAGWGGRLLQPPLINWEGDSLLVDDGINAYYLFVDAFGESWFRRPHSPLTETADPGPWHITEDGIVSYGFQTAHFPELAGWRQAVGNAHTLAIVMPRSFRIYCLEHGQGS